jgi:VIT1/CCC1 family predicted Fe2+/Mn2+ transporter
MAVDERSHARVLTRLRGTNGLPTIGANEPWHRGDRSGALRAAVFGVNDGLVSNASLVMGFAGSGATGAVILFAGLAGLLAGAFSMAAGEYLSMRSQREAYEREIALEAMELREDPLAESEELALIYRAKGLDSEQAARAAAAIMKDRDVALDTMAREELGLDPGALGSPWSAAVSSLLAFSLGAVVVVLPFVFGSGRSALISAIALATLALFAVGAAMGILNGRGAVRSGARQLLIGGVAALLVFGIGHQVGASTAAVR